jgi:hypothetical protein
MYSEIASGNEPSPNMIGRDRASCFTDLAHHPAQPFGLGLRAGKGTRFTPAMSMVY